MALTLTIGGVDRTSDLLYGSLSITLANGNRRGRADFTLVDARTTALATVTIADGGTTYFSGAVWGYTISERTVGHYTVEVWAADAGTAPAASMAPFSLSDRDAETTWVNYAGLNPYCLWRLGEPSGTTAADMMSHRNGTYVGSPTLGVAGAMTTGDTAVTLNGSSQYVDCGAAMLAGQADLSIAAWVKTSYSGANQVVYAEAIAGGGTPYVRFYISTSGRPTIQYRDNAGTEDTFAPTSGNWADGNWHNVVLAKRGSAITIYADGVSVRTATLTAGNTLSGGLSAHVGHDPIAGLHFNGSLDEVMVYRGSALPVDTPAALFLSRDIRRYASVSRSYTYDGVNDSDAYTVSTYEPGLAPGQTIALSSSNLLLLQFPVKVQEVRMTWANATTPLWTASCSETNPIHLPASLP